MRDLPAVVRDGGLLDGAAGVVVLLSGGIDSTLVAAIAAGIGLASLALVALPGVAGAQEVEPLPITGQQVNLLWVVLGAILVIFMQAGFALLECGMARTKNAVNVILKTYAGVCVAGGQSACTLTPKGFSSLRNAEEKPTTACFVAA